MKIGQLVSVKGCQYLIVDASKQGFKDNKLGSGLMADVFLAVRQSEKNADATLPDRLAIKAVRSGVGEDEARRSFQAECENLLIYQSKEVNEVSRADGSIVHHCPIVWEDQTQADEPFIAMELMTGESVYSRLLGGSSYPEPEALEIIRQLLTVLHTLHTGMYRTYIDLQLKDLYWQADVQILKVIDWNVLSVRRTASTLKPGPDLARAVSYLFQLLTGVGIGQNAVKLDQQGVPRRFFETAPNWSEVSPGTRDLIAAGLHPNSAKRYPTAISLQKAIDERLTAWEQTAVQDLSKAKKMIHEADSLSLKHTADRGRIVSLGQQCLDLVFLARRKPGAEAADIGYVDTYANKHALYGHGDLEAAGEFFGMSDYESASTSIDLAIQAGWGLNALRWKQAIKIGLSLKEQLKDQRGDLIRGLQAMQDGRWKNAEQFITAASERFGKPPELLNLLVEVKTRILLEEAAAAQEQAVSIQDPAEGLQKAASLIGLAMTQMNGITDDVYREDVLGELGNLSLKAETYQERGELWKRFLTDAALLESMLKTSQVDAALSKLQDMLLKVDRPLEQLQQSRLLKLIASFVWLWLDGQDYDKACRLSSGAAVLPWQRVDGLEDLKRGYRASELLTTSLNELTGGQVEQARQHWSEAGNFIAATLRDSITKKFGTVVAAQFAAAKEESELDMLLGWLSADFASRLPEVRTRMEILQAARQQEIDRRFERISAEAGRFSADNQVQNLKAAEDYLNVQIVAAQASPTLTARLGNLMNSIAQQRRNMEANMLGSSKQKERQDNYQAILIKCTSANSKPELEQFLTELREFQKETPMQPDRELEKQIKASVQECDKWIKGWEDHSQKANRLLDSLKAANNVQQYLDKRARTRLLKDASAYINLRALPPGSDVIRQIRDGSETLSGTWRIKLKRMDLEIEDKKPGLGFSIAVVLLSLIIGLVLGGFLLFGAYWNGILPVRDQPSPQASALGGTQESSNAATTEAVAVEPTAEPKPVPADLGIKLASATDPRLIAQDALQDNAGQRLLTDPATHKPFYYIAVNMPEDITVMPSMSQLKPGGAGQVWLNGASEPEKTIQLVPNGNEGWVLKFTDLSVLRAGAMNDLELTFEASNGGFISDHINIFWVPVVSGMVDGSSAYSRIVPDPSQAQKSTTDPVFQNGTTVSVIGWKEVENLSHPFWYCLDDSRWTTGTYVKIQFGFPLTDGSTFMLDRFGQTTKQADIENYLNALLPKIP